MKRNHKYKVMDRRTFFERSGRWTAGLFLGLLSGFLVLKRDIDTPAACGEDGICKQCLKNGRCEEPQAVKFRKKKVLMLDA